MSQMRGTGNSLRWSCSSKCAAPPVSDWPLLALRRETRAEAEARTAREWTGREPWDQKEEPMTATLRLYEVADAYERIAEALTENGGELTPDLAAQLDAIEGAFEAKVERVALYVRNLLVTADAADAEAARLAALVHSRRQGAEGLKGYLMAQLDRLEQPKVETPLVVVRIQQNSRPAIQWPDTLPIPEGYQRVTVSLDGQKAYSDWKAGVLPAGFQVEQGRHLRIS